MPPAISPDQVRLAVDIGGTFTDVVLETPDARYSTKVLTTKAAPEDGVLDSLPRSLEEAARIDGAGHLTILWRIVTPLAAPGLTAAAILTFLGAWGQYLVPLVFSPKATKPLTVMIPEFAGKSFIDYGLIMASGTVAIIVPCLVVIFLNRYLITGLLAGSGK